MHRTLWRRTFRSSWCPWKKLVIENFVAPVCVPWRPLSSNSSKLNPNDGSASAASSSGSCDTEANEETCPPDGTSEINLCIHSVVESKTKPIKAPVGITLMEAIRDIAKLDIEAACDGCCACSTCHVIFTPESYEQLREGPTEEELDMLDLAPSATKSSRLSCQVTLTEELDGIEVSIPDDMGP